MPVRLFEIVNHRQPLKAHGHNAATARIFHCAAIISRELREFNSRLCSDIKKYCNDKDCPSLISSFYQASTIFTQMLSLFPECFWVAFRKIANAWVVLARPRHERQYKAKIATKRLGRAIMPKLRSAGRVSTMRLLAAMFPPHTYFQLQLRIT
jgi:hypothetical protein